MQDVCRARLNRADRNREIRKISKCVFIELYQKKNAVVPFHATLRGIQNQIAAESARVCAGRIKGFLMVVGRTRWGPEYLLLLFFANVEVGKRIQARRYV
jgi:hypothetical protein